MKSFRLYPERTSPLYVEARIYRSRRLMLAALKRYDTWVGVRSDWLNTVAVCRTYDAHKRVGRRWIRLPRVSTVFLTVRRSGAGIVAHELAHAAVQYARRVRMSGSSVWGRSVREKKGNARKEPEANERFAYIMGELNRQFWVCRLP